MKGLKASISLAHATATFWINHHVFWGKGRMCFMMNNLPLEISPLSCILRLFEEQSSKPCSQALFPEYFL